MRYTFDLRYALLPLVSFTKWVISGKPEEWNPFDLLDNPTWQKICFNAVLLFVFCFISIEIFLYSSSEWFYIQFGVKKFSLSLMIAFLASLFFPQYIFWYFYPIIILLSVCPYGCAYTLLQRFVAQIMTRTVKVWITATNSGEDENNSEEIDVEAQDHVNIN